MLAVAAYYYVIVLVNNIASGTSTIIVPYFTRVLYSTAAVQLYQFFTTRPLLPPQWLRRGVRFHQLLDVSVADGARRQILERAVETDCQVRARENDHAARFSLAHQTQRRMRRPLQIVLRNLALPARPAQQLGLCSWWQFPIVPTTRSLVATRRR